MTDLKKYKNSANKRQKYLKNTYECFGVDLPISNWEIVCFRIKIILKDAQKCDELHKIKDYFYTC